MWSIPRRHAGKGSGTSLRAALLEVLLPWETGQLAGAHRSLRIKRSFMLGVFDRLFSMSSRSCVQKGLRLPEHSKVAPYWQFILFCLLSVLLEAVNGESVSGISGLSPLQYRWKPVLQVISACRTGRRPSAPCLEHWWAPRSWDYLPDSFFLEEERKVQ